MIVGEDIIFIIAKKLTFSPELFSCYLLLFCKRIRDLFIMWVTIKRSETSPFNKKVPVITMIECYIVFSLFSMVYWDYQQKIIC